MYDRNGGAAEAENDDGTWNFVHFVSLVRYTSFRLTDPSCLASFRFSRSDR